MEVVHAHSNLGKSFFTVMNAAPLSHFRTYGRMLGEGERRNYGVENYAGEKYLFFEKVA